MEGKRFSRSWRERFARPVALVAAVAAVVGLSACGGSSSTSTGGQASTGGQSVRQESVTIGLKDAPLSLDPAKNSLTADQQIYTALAYEPLVTLKPDGSLAPGLATSWRYVGKSGKAFELTLRPEAKFSDGSALTPQAVVDSIAYIKKVNGPVASYAKAIKSVEVSGPHTVRMNLVRADPTIPFLLTRRFLLGSTVSRKGTASPKVLGTTTNGAGPYKLDPSETVANDHYTFVPNPYYYNQDAIHFKKFVVRVITNPQTALNALQSGQIAFATGNVTLAPAAEAAGLDVTSTRSAWYGLVLLDHGGTTSKPLGNQLVRQALNYATDREGITKALFGEYGEANPEPTLPGYEEQGYVPSYKDRYPYDPEKARKLLAEAGYPNGFTVKIGATNAYGNGTDMTQAVASDWAKVGVKVDIQDYPTINAIVPAWGAKKLPAVAVYYDAQPMFIFAQNTMFKDSGFFNVFGDVDSELSAKIDDAFAVATDPDKAGAAWEAVTKRVVDLGWFVPIASGPNMVFSAKDLKGVELSPTAFGQDPTLLHY